MIQHSQTLWKRDLIFILSYLYPSSLFKNFKAPYTYVFKTDSAKNKSGIIKLIIIAHARRENIVGETVTYWI